MARGPRGDSRPSPHSPRGTDWRTAVAGIDPGLVRLRLASIAVVSMACAAGLTELVRLFLAPTEPVTVLLFAGVVAMISNLAVNEPELARLRATTALMAVPAVVATVAGTLLSPYRIVADVVFVLVMVAAVYVRKYGPRGFALGQIAFMAFFFTQFLKVQPAQLPWLVVAVLIGLGSTLLLRGVVFAERRERTLRRLVAAFRARAHALVLAVDAVLGELAEVAGSPHDVDDAVVERMRRARKRLNDVALQVEDQLEQIPARRVWPGLDNATLALRVFDAELALERLSVSVRRVVRPPEGDEGDQRPDALALTALRVGLGHLRDALASRTGHEAVLEAAEDARAAVAGLVAVAGARQERVQRTAFAVRRVADAVHHAQRDAPADGHERRRGRGDEAGHDDMHRPGASPEAVDEGTDVDDGSTAPTPRDGLLMTTRQAIQVGVATTLAIVVGELIAPSRWYWAVIAAFVIFTGTQSRGDLLSRGWGRVAGTVGGVAAGMGLAALVGGQTVPSLVLLFACVFLALYLVRVSPALLAFWITAVLALVYGLIGQFSVGVLVLRIEETAAGAAAAVLAAFLVLPKGTRAAFGEAVDDLVDTMDEVFAGTVDRLVGRRPAANVLERARDMDTALQTLRARTATLSGPNPRRRGRSSYQRGLRVLVVCDHYLRSLVRLSDSITEPGWEATLRPAAEQVRANLDGLRDVLARGRRRSDGGRVLVVSAETLVDAAEAHAARTGDREPGRTDKLTAARLLRRIDQAVVGLAVDLGAAADTERETAADDPADRVAATGSTS